MPQVTLLPADVRIPVASVFVIGRNYIADPAERAAQARQPPIVSLKPTSAVILEGEAIRLPRISERVNFEIELLVLIGRGGRDIDPAEALRHVLGYGVGLDLTAHDLHQAARAQGLPWTVSKGFDTAAPLSAFLHAEQVPDPQALEFELYVNDTLRQRGQAADMVFSVAEIVSYLSTVFTLQRGDVIFTGTPAGADRLQPGDRLRLDLMGRIQAHFAVAG